VTTIHDLTPEQMGTLVEQFSEIEVDRMDTKQLQAEHTEMLIEHYAKKTPDQLKELIEADDKDLLAELIDNTLFIHKKEKT
tara:strand:- start:3006 stop:3248 length:243 start_codon:yes stop_codon:yes gene_type:complete